MKNLKQLALNLCLQDQMTLENFFSGSNAQLLSLLQNINSQKSPFFLYIWGNQGSGKTHLLSAMCHQFGEKGLGTAYLPLQEHLELSPRMLEESENLDLLCIDDLDEVVGIRDWEEELFHCFNKLLDHGGKLLITANAPPLAMQFCLPDLQSRMASTMIFQLSALNDEEKESTLIMRAKLRGLKLNSKAVRFLLNHYARDAATLFNALEKLDHAALVAKKQLTLPFIKEVLNIQS